MTRPRCCFRIGYCPPAGYFRPIGRPAKRPSVVEMTAGEAEALRLKNIVGLDQTESAERMGVSQSTFQRVLASAYHKVSDAIVHGKAIRIAEPSP